MQFDRILLMTENERQAVQSLFHAAHKIGGFDEAIGILQTYLHQQVKDAFCEMASKSGQRIADGCMRTDFRQYTFEQLTDLRDHGEWHPPINLSNQG